MANSVDPDQMLHSVMSDLGLHCLCRLICPKFYGNYGMSHANSKGPDQCLSIKILQYMFVCVEVL